MTEQTKQKLKYWLIGIFTGGAVAAPVTAFITKKVYEKKIEENVAAASESGYNSGINDMAAYVVRQMEEEAHQDQALSDEDINDYDVSIDDLDAMNKSKERTEAHERYLDMIEQYSGNSDSKPYIINEEQFVNEQYMKKSYVNWYEDDDVFEEDLNTIDDPYATFGVTTGRELFRNAELRHDPDICYVRNPKVSTDFEVSRIHGSYTQMVRGESSLGETDT